MRYWLRCINRDGTRHEPMLVEGGEAGAVPGDLIHRLQRQYRVTRNIGGVWEAVEVDPES